MLWWNCAASVFLIAMLQTRAVWLGFATTLFIFSLLYLLRLRSHIAIKKIVVGAVVLVAVIFVFIFSNKSASAAVLQRLSLQKALTGESSTERLKVWNNSWQLIKEHPLAGVGEGNWQYNFLKYGIRDIPSVQQRFTVFQSPHNDYLWIASETGIPGLLLFLGLLLAPAFVCLRIIFGAGDKIKASVCFSFLLGYLVYSFFDFPRYRVEHNFLLTVILCSVFPVKHEQEKQKNKKGLHVIFWPVFVFGCLFFVFRAKGEYYAKQLIAARAKQQTDKIIKYAEKARSVFYPCDPTGIPLEWYMGHAYNSMQQTDLAHDCFAKAIQHAPYNFYMLGDLAAAELLKQQYTGAEAHLLEAVRINDKYEEGYYNLATLFFYQNNLEKALFYAEKTAPSEKHNYFVKTITAKQKEAVGI
jgi:tetratricopeptide (TPR) repeat protein